MNQRASVSWSVSMPDAPPRGRWRLSVWTLRYPLVGLMALLVLLGALVPTAEAARRQEKELPLRYRAWLDEVRLILRRPELKTFLSLEKDYQRDGFIREFWRSRDPYPETPRNEFKHTWETRLAISRDRWGNITDDQPRIFMLLGEPDEVRETDCIGVTEPLEVWLYHYGKGLPTNTRFLFYEPYERSPWVLWNRTIGFGALWAGDYEQRQDRDSFFSALRNSCPHDWDWLSRVIVQVEMEDRDGVLAAGQSAPAVKNTEWLSTFIDKSTELVLPPEGGDPLLLTARADFGFPESYGERTLVQAVIRVDTSNARASDLVGGSPAYHFVLTGEVLREDELFESFRYKFELPATEGSQVPLLFERPLRPGRYQLIVKIEDGATGAQARLVEELAVPALEGYAVSAEARAEVDAALEQATRNLADEAPTIRLLAPEGDAHVGSLRVEAETSGRGIRKVSFFLNGEPLLTKTRPPYSVEMKLGDLPRSHRVAALALDAAGRELARDELRLNEGAQAFTIRLLEPRQGGSYDGSLTAQAEVKVPDGRTLSRVEIWLDDDRIATLYQEPFRQPVRLAAGGKTQVVRAVGFLDDESFAETTVLINAPGYTEDVQVRVVELYASAFDRAGRPVPDLARDEFQVMDGGQPQTLLRFDRVEDLPIHAALLLDTSSSMEENLPQAREAAMAFLREILTPRDRAAVLAFSDQPVTLAPLTGELPVLARALGGLRAQGGTVLYDSVIFALQYLKGVRGQRAVLLLTDGGDRASRFSYGEMLEVARRSGVVVYTVGLGISKVNLEARLKLKSLAGDTGGQSFFIESADELAAVYGQIQAELRSRYLLAYQPPPGETGKAKEAFRPIRVEVERPGVTVETIKGYYP